MFNTKPCTFESSLIPRYMVPPVAEFSIALIVLSHTHTHTYRLSSDTVTDASDARDSLPPWQGQGAYKFGKIKFPFPDPLISLFQANIK